ncbi:hypothetical protein MKL09_25105 [Methylobacterium sp. J-048]|uniref:hypothetical protein n=1 Tax=Methylobacterium sp. J-048 TaxID=2836635 RepID=UPI001FBAC913|nr:hypothetical protein [Methylobacterium sp. J-048]MCJ2059797.1 hypothetical protein [Methylobacterium sp. J-048]
MSNRPLLRRAALVLGLMGVLLTLADVVARRELTQAADESFGRGEAIARTAAATE